MITIKREVTREETENYELRVYYLASIINVLGVHIDTRIFAYVPTDIEIANILKQYIDEHVYVSVRKIYRLVEVR